MIERRDEKKALGLTSSAAFRLLPAFPLSRQPIVEPGVPTGLAIPAPRTGELTIIMLPSPAPSGPPPLTFPLIDMRWPKPGTGTNDGGGVADESPPLPNPNPPKEPNDVRSRIEVDVTDPTPTLPSPSVPAPSSMPSSSSLEPEDCPPRPSAKMSSSTSSGNRPAWRRCCWFAPDPEVPPRVDRSLSDAGDMGIEVVFRRQSAS